MSTATSHCWLVATLVTDPVCVCFGFQSVRSAAGEIIRGRTLEEDKTPEREKRPTRAAYLHARRPREALALAMSEQVVYAAEVDVEPPSPGTIISKWKVNVGTVHNHMPTWQGQKNKTGVGGCFSNIHDATTH